MIRRPPRSTHCISSAASDVYKRQILYESIIFYLPLSLQIYLFWTYPNQDFQPYNIIDIQEQGNGFMKNLKMKQAKKSSDQSLAILSSQNSSKRKDSKKSNSYSKSSSKNFNNQYISGEFDKF
eukprot:TRINITY_DN12370_c0_g1_i3.p1 TRINITY_DN12370_c0_g1~~TRINITY_DN12370_c0_g1_i3.p1  ORF type:complete len:123 (+),score=38.28 TRINITY_DN12370_c0_g1_i3:92-460(+)